MKNKNKFKYLTLGILLTGAVGFSTLAVKQVQVNAKSENVVNINREKKKLVEFDNVNYKITITPNELINYTWENFNNAVYNAYDTEGSEAQIFESFEYGNYVVDETHSTNQPPHFWELTLDLYDQSENAYTLQFNKDYDVQEDWVGYRFTLDGTTEDLDNNANLVIYVNDTNYWTPFVNAINLDIQANESSYGESIITAISSGLGLIPDLAQEFLSGFTTLFWDATNEKLTDFGTFALVFLGVAITMAVVKLCLAILRSNTGA